MPDITVTITASEQKAMEYIAVSPSEWIENLVKVRAEKAGDDIIDKLVRHCNANDIALAVGRDAQITQAYTLNLVTALADVTPADV